MTTLERKNDNVKSEKDFLRIKAGLAKNISDLSQAISSRVMQGNWRLYKKDCSLKNGETIDMVFSAPQGRKETYLLVDISVPHLLTGQKYTLPSEAKAFQKDFKVPANRIKKAIFLIRKGTETISARPSRIRCPIIELQYEDIIKKTEPAENKNSHEKSKKDQPHKNNSVKNDSEKNNKTVSEDLLTALKEAVVHECLSTMHKRRNKYVCKGLWKWIENEIIDPNVHFFLVMLSSIYQGRTGEILSRKFKTVNAYSERPHDIANVIFSKENNLADEIKKNSARHQKALGKFLACFAQTPPFDYLKSVFLKEYRTCGYDGLKARMSVFSTLNQLLERCGFEGEKETQYPLEILDELGIFKGILTGNYSQLRVENASKKLKHLVPQIEWGEKEIYQLRNQLAKALNLPSQEFNLNAFLPQAFVQDAKHIAQSKKESIRSQSIPVNRNQNTETFKPVVQQKSPPPPRQTHTRNNYNQDHRKELPEKPITVPVNQQDEPEARKTNYICDESRHRFFENFGGHLEEDREAIKLALAIERHEQQKATKKQNKQQEADLIADEAEANHIPPTKSSTQKPRHDPPIPRKKLSSNHGNHNNKNRRRNTSSKNGNYRSKHRRPNNSNGAHR